MTTSAAALRVVVTAQQRLALGVASEVSYFTDSHPYVPGSVLRGALAAAWITEHGPPTTGSVDAARFQALFDGQIRYGPLYPLGVQRVPLSVHRCKYPLDPVCEAVAIDHAFDTTSTCPSCRRRLEQSKGQLHPQPAMTRTTRTTMDPATGRAADRQLYAHAALPARTVLTGTLYGSDPWLQQPRTLRLGGRRTVGGTADFHTEPAPHPPASAPDTSSGQLVIRLVSPAVLVDVAGRPRLDPDPTLDLHGARVQRSWNRPITWSGWHAASRLPKPTDLCAEAGSTYRLAGDPQTLTRLAQQILADGLGLRRAEGFGIVEVVTQPWQPTPPAGEKPTAAGDPSGEALRRLNTLGLAPPEYRWLTGALRGLQIEQQRSGFQTVPDDILDELLAQPTAADLSGRQREDIRQVLTGLDTASLRNLTTLILANTPQDPR